MLYKNAPRIKIGKWRIRYIQIPEGRYFCVDLQHSESHKPWYEMFRISHLAFQKCKQSGGDTFAFLKEQKGFSELRWDKFWNNVELHDKYLDR